MNSWKTAIYSYRETSTTTNHTALYLYKRITSLPTCTVFTSWQDHIHANEDFCKTTKHMAYQNLLISFIWPTRIDFTPTTSTWHTRFAAYMWISSCLLLVSHCPQCGYFKLCLLNIGQKHRHFKNSFSSMQIFGKYCAFWKSLGMAPWINTDQKKKIRKITPCVLL